MTDGRCVMADQHAEYVVVAPGIRIIRGREMRGGLEGGHWHMAWVSSPSLKGPGAWIDCPACVEWAEERLHTDGPVVRAQDSPRWCERCQKWGDHHTDRCTQFDGSACEP